MCDSGFGPGDEIKPLALYNYLPRWDERKVRVAKYLE